MPQEYIEIRGARENNLKNVSLRIPKRKITDLRASRARASRRSSSIPSPPKPSAGEREFQYVHPLVPASLFPARRRCHREPEHAGRGRSETAGRRIAFDVRHDYRYLPGAAPAVFAHRKTARGTCECLFLQRPQGHVPELQRAGPQAGRGRGSVPGQVQVAEQGAILFPEYAVDSWGFNFLGRSKLFDMDKKLTKFNEKEMDLLLYSKPLS